jgi:hypothetical protein
VPQEGVVVARQGHDADLVRVATVPSRRGNANAQVLFEALHAAEIGRALGHRGGQQAFGDLNIVRCRAVAAFDRREAG